MTRKRVAVSLIYFVVVILTLTMRVMISLGLFDGLGEVGEDALWSCIIQILIFGIVPLGAYMLFVLGKGDEFLPYFTHEEAEEIKEERLADEVAQVFEDNTLAEEKPANEEPAEQPKADKKSAFKEFCEDFGFRKLSVKDALCVLVLAVCMIVVASGVSLVWQIVLKLLGFTHIPSDTDYSSMGVLFRELFLVAVLPGVFEEFAHRGLLWAGYKKTGYKFVIVSALLFSLMHQNIVQTGYTFVDGLVMALVLYYTRSIWATMFMHFLNNAVSVSLGYIDQNGGPFAFIIRFEDWLYSTTLGLLVMFIGFVLAAGIAVLMIILIRKNAVKAGRIKRKAFEEPEDKYPRHKDPMFIITVVVGIAATIFSFVWGILR
ncbi:MAG: CPBP family intramembrane metalloprotease [Clostridia bacterium]|nr:CPBP family intramembrane metalloprotease [Clostridia bacterium]